MAHIPDGVVSLPVLISGGTIAAAGCYYALKNMDPEEIPKIAMVTAMLFVASFIRVPLGPASLHLLMTAIAGILLGRTVFPAFLISLLLQAMMFGYGGLLVLGVNLTNMAVPAFACALLYQSLKGRFENQIFLSAFFAGAAGVMMTGLMVATSLFLSGQSFQDAAQVILASHLPLMILEGIVTGFVVCLMVRVKPESLAVPRLRKVSP